MKMYVITSDKVICHSPFYCLTTDTARGVCDHYDYRQKRKKKEKTKRKEEKKEAKEKD